MKSLNESKHGFWGALARKAKAILDDDNGVQQPEVPGRMREQGFGTGTPAGTGAGAGAGSATRAKVRFSKKIDLCSSQYMRGNVIYTVS